MQFFRLFVVAGSGHSTSFGHSTSVKLQVNFSDGVVEHPGNRTSSITLSLNNLCLCFVNNSVNILNPLHSFYFNFPDNFSVFIPVFNRSNNGLPWTPRSNNG